jgi:hypothetical protein
MLPPYVRVRAGGVRALLCLDLLLSQSTNTLPSQALGCYARIQYGKSAFGIRPHK